MMTTIRNLSKSELQILARLFSPFVVNELGAKGKSGLIGRFLNGGIGSSLSEGAPTIGHVFDLAFRQIRVPGNRPEYVFMNALVLKRLLGKHNLNTATLEREFRVGSSRLDVAIFNGTSTAYEIKSDWDSLDRLKGQVSDYQRVFESVYVFTTGRHIELAMLELPEEVGILALSDRFSISEMRRARPSQSSLDTRTIFESLRTDEVKRILENCGFRLPDVPNTKMRSAMLNEFLELSAREAHQGMVDVLKITRSLRSASDIVDQLPRSILPAVLTASFTKPERCRIVEALTTPVEVALEWR